MGNSYREKLLKAVTDEKALELTWFLISMSGIILSSACSTLMLDYPEVTLGDEKTGGESKHDNRDEITEREILSVIYGKDFPRNFDLFRAVQKFLKGIMDVHVGENIEHLWYHPEIILDKWDYGIDYVDGGDNSEQE